MEDGLADGALLGCMLGLGEATVVGMGEGALEGRARAPPVTFTVPEHWNK